MIKSKKGGLGDFLLSFYSTIILLVIFLVFFTLFVISAKISKENTINAVLENTNLQTILRGVSTLPLSIDGNKWTYSDLALFAATENKCNGLQEEEKGDYCKLFESKSREYLAPFKEKFWNLQLYSANTFDDQNSKIFVQIINLESKMQSNVKCENFPLFTDVLGYKVIGLKFCAYDI